MDTTAVILVTHFWAKALPIDENSPLVGQLLTFIVSGYIFKMVVALVDTGPIYGLVAVLRPWLGMTKDEEIGSDDEPVAFVDNR